MNWGWCQHNEVDLVPKIVPINQIDWVVVHCKGCEKSIGESVSLIELVTEAVEADEKAQAILDNLDIDWKKMADDLIDHLAEEEDEFEESEEEEENEEEEEWGEEQEED